MQTFVAVSVYLLLNGVLVCSDLRRGLLPDRFTCPLLWSGLLLCSLMTPALLADKLWGAALGYAGFALIYWAYRLLRRGEGLGYGDVKFLAALGAWHGWQPLCALVFIAAALACVFTALRALCHGNLGAIKNPLPFGPFLSGAGLIVGWYAYSEQAFIVQL